MLENLIKGWVLSLIGLAGVVAIILHIVGVYEFPNPQFLSKTWEAVAGIVVCLGLFIMPKNKIDEAVEKAFKFVINKFTGDNK